MRPIAKFTNGLTTLPSGLKFALGLLFFMALSFIQSEAAEGQLGGCPCGCSGGCRFSGAGTSDEIDSRIGSRWNFTATDGATTGAGDAVTLTWGIAAEGSPIGDAFGANTGPEGSSFVDFLDNATARDPNSTGGADLTQRDWFSLFEDSANRISQVSGVTFNFESNDDGAPLFSAPAGGGLLAGPAGALGTRADIRIGGRSVDGQTGGNVLAFAFPANIGETVFDTDNVNFFSSTFNDSVGFRNVLTHELFHALGISHVDSAGGASFLLNPTINTSFDGPQLDDILVLQRNYGDFLESSNDQLGNNSIATATVLGLLSDDNSLSAGQEVDDTVIGFDEVGFVSINDATDVDVFEFSLSELSEVSIDLSPEGASYLQGVENGTLEEIDTLELNDLALQLFDSDGNLIAAADDFGLGLSESILQTLDAGTFFVEVSGSSDEIQLFTLGLSSSVVAVPEPGSVMIVVGMFGFLQVRRRRN